MAKNPRALFLLHEETKCFTIDETFWNGCPLCRPEIMKDILVLVTLQPLLRAIQKYILEEDRARVDIQYCKNLNGIIDFIDKKLPSSVEVIISTPGPSFFIAQLIKKKIPILPLEYNNIDIIKSLHMALSVCPGGVAYGHYLQETQWLDDIRKW